jgi:acetyl esterase/lipase
LPAGKVQKKGWPVMVMIHGGCWQAEYDYVYFTRLADWMTTQGFATWTIEYARLGDATGGWPGTFTDVGKATDALRMIAKTSPLDLHHVYAAGHSAGGQLALWLPSRNKLPKTSALYLKHPLPIRGVLGLAAITDLDTYRIGPEDSCHASVDPLLGGSPESFPERYAESSPLRRLPLGVPQVFIQGDKDTIVDPAGVSRYVDTAIAAGDLACILPLPGRGHFDTAVATPVSETALLDALKQLRR